LLDLIGRRGPRRVAGEPALTGLQGTHPVKTTGRLDCSLG
jgi:hypothetical protein